MNSYIHYEVADRICVITIDRPEKRNAMTWAMLGEFRAAVARAGDDPTVAVVIVTGAGGAFCAGTDLADLAKTPEQSRGGQRSTGERERGWFLVDCPKPVIAAVDGAAVGMGAEFTSQCDVRIASSRARFAWNFAQRGLVPDMGAGSWLLPRLISVQAALRLLYSGDFLTAEGALELGYVAQVVQPEELLPAARAEAARFLQSSPFSHQRIKELVYRGLERNVLEHMKHHRQALQECFGSQDHAEGVASFLERRAPRFTGR